MKFFKMPLILLMLLIVVLPFSAVAQNCTSCQTATATITSTAPVTFQPAGAIILQASPMITQSRVVTSVVEQPPTAVIGSAPIGYYIESPKMFILNVPQPAFKMKVKMRGLYGGFTTVSPY